MLRFYVVIIIMLWKQAMLLMIVLAGKLWREYTYRVLEGLKLGNRFVRAPLLLSLAAVPSFYVCECLLLLRELDGEESVVG